MNNVVLTLVAIVFAISPSVSSLFAQTQPAPPMVSKPWSTVRNSSIFFRGDAGIARNQTASVIDKPVGGFSFGGMSKIARTPFHVGGSVGMLGFQSRSWDAPFTDPTISVSEARHTNTTALVDGMGFLRVELLKDWNRIVPFAEGGIGGAMIYSEYEVTMENPQDNCDIWTLDRRILSRDFTATGYAGGGALVRLTRLSNPDAGHSRVYLDLFGGTRTSFGEPEFYYGKQWERHRNALDFLQLRAGFLFRIDCPDCRW